MDINILKEIKNQVGNECEVKMSTNEIGFGIYLQIDWWDGSEKHFRKQLSVDDLEFCDVFLQHFIHNAKQFHDNKAHAADKEPRSVPPNN